MRVYRSALLTSLAGLTVVLLGTAVYALQMPPSPIPSNALHKQTQREVPLRISERGAEYLAIVADEPDFMNALAPLLRHREENGLQVTAVSLAQIASEFGEDTVSAQAIHDFLAYAAENWQPAPQFVLLVGDTTSGAAADGAAQDLLPTHLLENENGADAASDSWFIDFASETPITVGRFPVQTSEQLTAVVNKTIAYETAVNEAPHAPWLNRALLIADDAPDFDAASDNLETTLDNSGYQIHDLHMSQNQDIYTAIVSVLNRGVGILNYSGHGSKTSFADGIAFTAEDARLLQNQHRLPIFTAFSCQNGAFTDPDQASIAEQLLLTENGGIVAAIGTSGHMETDGSLMLAGIFYNQFLHGNASTLGEVLIEMKTAVHGDAELETAVYSYNLLGDPALHIHQPIRGKLVKPPQIPNPALFVNNQ